LTSILNDASNNPMLRQLQPMYRFSLHTISFANSAVGTLATDQSRIYLVDDLAIPPHPQWLQQWIWNGRAEPAYGGNYKTLVNQNVLRAYDLESGKSVWELPGRIKPGDLADTHFLGAPLPLDNQLYVLNEKKKKLRLLCLEPKQGKVLWTLNLARVVTPVTMDVSRRTDAVNLAYGDGVLVCPTGAGVILGIDLMTRGLRWTYSYWEPPRRPVFGANPWGRPMKQPWGRLMKPQAPEPEWGASAAVISDGKVVFAAREGESIHCLNLRDGSLQWKVKRADDLYLAGVYGGKVLLAGMDECRALALNTGKQLWALQTGLPCGQGVAGPDVYYLPLAKGEICVIDLAKGRIKAHIRSHRKDVALGNLVFHDGYMLSQSATHIAAYPLLAVRIKAISALLAKNPNDPHGLTERGELRLADGKVQGAVDDLRKVLAGKPSGKLRLRVRLKLYEAFDEFFQKDFDAAAPKYLNEFEDLCRTDNADETRRQRSRFLYLVASGRERQGKLVEALRLYMAFADLAPPRQLITAPDDLKLKVRPDLWLGGHIKALFARANAAQRKALEAEIQKQWETIKKPRKGKG
jgi:outer membrane protein assembly factor BamB